MGTAAPSVRDIIHGVGLDILTGVVNIKFDQFLGTNASKAVTPKDL